jgi:hypothetical protein
MLEARWRHRHVHFSSPAISPEVLPEVRACEELATVEPPKGFREPTAASEQLVGVGHQ